MTIAICNYHSSWDSLIEVIKKFSSLKIEDVSTYTTYVKKKSEIKDALVKMDIELCFQKLVQFLEWYSQHRYYPTPKNITDILSQTNK